MVEMNGDALLVVRAERRAPVAIPIAGDFDLPRLATDRAVLYVDLARSAAVIDVELHGLSTVRTVR
jgi:hypothetical protein